MTTGILGGGLTGLCLANFLQEKLVILEKNYEVGGLCRSLQEEGFTFDYGGSHIIFSRDEDILHFMLNLLGDNKFRVRRNAKILYKGRYVKYPFENGLADLSKEDNYECLYYYVYNLLNNNDFKHGNFKEWIYATFGKGIAEKYMIPYNEKIWNMKSESMGADWVERRIPKPPLEDVIKSSLGIQTEGYTHQLFFYYPKRGGIQSLVKELESKARGVVTCDFHIKSICKEDGLWLVKNERDEKMFDRIISTIHLKDLVEAIKDVPEEIISAVNGLRYNSLISVMLGLEVSRLNDISWIYMPEANINANRVSFPSNYSRYVAPPGKSSLLAEITCNEGDDLWSRRDEEIIEETIDDLHKIGIIDRKSVCYSQLRRSKYAYVVYDLRYAEKISLIHQYFHNIGIHLCGRFSQFEYLNMDACVRSAMNKAQELAEERVQNENIT
jgi:protoporphyrinogen oxidase